MRIEIAAGLSGIAALLTILAGGIVIGGLKLLRRIEVYVPPGGASRVPIPRKRGEIFPWRVLPKDIRTQIFRKKVVFLFLSEGCPICMDLLPNLRAFVRGYRHLNFVICSVSPMHTMHLENVLVVTGKELFRALGIALIPYAVQVDRQRIVEYGVADCSEHLESILEATLEEGLE